MGEVGVGSFFFLWEAGKLNEVSFMKNEKN